MPLVVMGITDRRARGATYHLYVGGRDRQPVTARCPFALRVEHCGVAADVTDSGVDAERDAGGAERVEIAIRAHLVKLTSQLMINLTAELVTHGYICHGDNRDDRQRRGKSSGRCQPGSQRGTVPALICSAAEAPHRHRHTGHASLRST